MCVRGSKGGLAIEPLSSGWRGVSIPPIRDILTTLKETPLAKAEIFIKAVEVEAGLALPADVSIKLSKSTK